MFFDVKPKTLILIYYILFFIGISAFFYNMTFFLDENFALPVLITLVFFSISIVFFIAFGGNVYLKAA